MPTDPFADLAETLPPTRRSRRSDYRDLYEEVGQKHGVNPDLLHRQAKQESSLNPRAVGPPTKYGIAKGIAQFIPSTAREYGMVVSKERDDRLDPEKAADAQARLMRKLIDRYKGDERLALSAYNCFDDQTEVLSDDGWKLFKFLRPEDQVASMSNKGCIEFGCPLERQTYSYEGFMLRFKSQSVDCCVTPNHRMLVGGFAGDKTHPRGKARLLEADKIAGKWSHFYLVLAAQGHGRDYPLSDNEIRLAAWVITDGTINKSASSWRVLIYQRTQKSHLVKEILRALGWAYTSRVVQLKTTHVCGRKLLTPPSPIEHIRLSAASRDKLFKFLPHKNHLPPWVYALSRRQFDVFLRAYIDGDGCYSRYSRRYAEVSGTVSMMSELQVAAVMNGCRAQFVLPKNKNHALLYLYFDKDISQLIVKNNLTVEPYVGEVYCVTTKNGTVVTRRNGRVTITGNSGTNRSAGSARRAMQRIPQTRDYVQKITGGHASIKAPPEDKFADLGEREQDPFADLAEASLPVVQSTTPPVRQRPTRPASPFAGVQAGVKGKVVERPRIQVPDLNQILTEARQSPEAEATFQRRERANKEISIVTRRRPTEAEIQGHVAGEKAQEDLQKEAKAERERLVAQFTPEDKAQVLRVADQLRRHGPGVKRGLDKAIQGATSSALYQLAGLTGAADLWQGPNALGDNLRRKALAGELSIEEVADLPQPQREKVAEFLTGMVAGLPALTAATTLGGPVAGFAALGGTEALGRNRPAEEVATETAKGATLGKVFKQAGQIKNVPKELAAIGAGTAAVESAFGASPEEALQAAGGNILFAGGMKAIAGRRFYHKDWGNVRVVEDQTGARAGRVRVEEEADPSKQHFPKKSDLSGSGNQRMVPIKPGPEVVIPPVVEEARQRIAQRVPQGRSEAPTDLPATPVSAERPASELPVEAAQLRAETTASTPSRKVEGWHFTSTPEAAKAIKNAGFQTAKSEHHGEYPDPAEGTWIRTNPDRLNLDAPGARERGIQVSAELKPIRFETPQELYDFVDPLVGRKLGNVHISEVSRRDPLFNKANRQKVTDELIKRGYNAIEFGEGFKGEAHEPGDFLVLDPKALKPTITPEQRATEYAQAERDVAVLPAERRLNPRDAGEVWTSERRERAKVEAIARVSEGAAPIELRQRPVPAREAEVVKPWEMSKEQIEQEFQRKKAEDDNLEAAVLGPELAKRYARLQRTANSMNAEKADAASVEIERIEASLSERNRNRLYGIGERGPQLDDLRNYRQSLGNLDDSSPEALGQSMRWAISRVGKETDPTKMTHEQQVAFGTLREAARIAHERDWNTQAISREAVRAAGARFSDPEDAQMMLDRFIKKEPTPAPRQALSAAREEVIQQPSKPVRKERPNAVEKALAPEKIEADTPTRGAGETGESPAPKPTVLETASVEAKAKLDALGPEPPKPSSEARHFGQRGRATADSAEVARYDAEVKAHNAWKRKYSLLKKAEVAASNAAFYEKQNAPSLVTSAAERQAKRVADEAAGIELRRSGADPYELVDNIIVKGWDLYSQKVKPTFEEWSRKLREEFGPESESHLKKVWAQLGGPETTERVRPRQGERSFPGTVEEAGYQGGKNRTYDILPNIETTEKANATIKEKGVDLAAAELSNKQGEFSSEDVAVGSRVIQIYEQQGKMDKAIETAENLAEALTKAGQTVQAASIIARLSPEGTLLYAQRKLPAGQKLTVEQGEKLVGQSKKVKTLEDSVKAKDAEATIPDLQEQVKFLKEGKPRPRAIERAKEKIGTLEDRLTKMEVDAQARLTQAFGGSTFRSGIDPVILKDLAVVGAVKIAKKGMTAAKWELEMVDKFGEKIKPHLKKIYRSSFDLYDTEKRTFRQEQLERSAIKRGATPETLQSEINARLDEMSQLRKERAEMQRMFNELDQTKWGKRMRTVFDATGIPHAAMTAFDLSFGLRQGKMGFVRHPKIWAEMMKRQVKALNNTEFSRMVSELEADPDFKYARRFKLELTSPAVSGTKLATKEEGFQSHMAEKIPGIKRSEQAFATAGDWMRMPWFKDYMAKGRRAGFDPENPADFHVFEDGASLINAATGRGNLGKYGNAVAPILNRATFSARFWASRVKMLILPIDPRTYTTMSKPARVEALKTVFGFYALVGAQLMLARASGATVGLDPDKPDFMKANWGPVHIDFSAGHQGHLRFAAHLVKAIYEEQVQGKKRGDYQTPSAITQTYLRGKEAPLVSLAHDTFLSKKDKQGYGTDIIGRSSHLFGDPKASKFDRVSGSAIMRRLEPLVYQDAKQAYDQMGWSGVGIVTPLVAAGESVQTYQPKKIEPSKFPSVRTGASNVGRPNAGGRP